MENLAKNTQGDRTGIIADVLEIEGRLTKMKHRLRRRLFLSS